MQRKLSLKSCSLRRGWKKDQNCHHFIPENLVLGLTFKCWEVLKDCSIKILASSDIQEKNCTCSELQHVCRQGGLLVQQLTLFKKCSKNKYLSKESAVFQGAWPKIYCRTVLLQANLFLKLKSFLFGLNFFSF